MVMYHIAFDQVYQNLCDDDHWASAQTVCVVQLVPMADSRTKRLCVLLTVSNSCHCSAHMSLIQPLLMSNKRCPQIVATTNLATGFLLGWQL